MKGLFIPDITAEMFRNGCLEGIEALMAEGEIYDIDYTPKQKIGKWILADEQSKEDTENDNYRFICSECGCSDIQAKSTIIPYCWKCGAKMEREDK